MTMTGDIQGREFEKFYDIGAGTTAVRTYAMSAGAINTAMATLSIASAKTAGTATSAISGMIYKVTQGVGTLSGTPGTIDTKLVDSTGGTIAVIPTQAESSTATCATAVPITTSMKWILPQREILAELRQRQQEYR